MPKNKNRNRNNHPHQQQRPQAPAQPESATEAAPPLGSQVPSGVAEMRVSPAGDEVGAASAAAAIDPPASAGSAADLTEDVATAAMSTISVLRKLIGDLSKQRDELIAEMSTLGTKLQNDRRTASEQHAQKLADEIRALNDKHSALVAEAKSRHDEEIATDRKRKLDALLKDVEAERAREMEKINVENRDRKAAFQRDLESLSAAKLEILQQRENAAEEREQAVAAREKAAGKAQAHADAQLRNAQAIESLASQERDAAESRVTEAVERATRSLQNQLAESRRELDREVGRATELDAEVRELRSLARAFGENPEEMLANYKEVKKQNNLLKDRIAEAPSEETIQKLQGENAGLTSQLVGFNEKVKELAKLKAEKAGWVQTAAQREDALRALEGANQRRLAVEAQYEALLAEVNKLRALHERPKEREARVREINRPVEARREPAEVAGDEMAWLDRIERDFKKAGLVFNRRLLHSFHTSLKTAEWSPLTVLSGVSGTGKSKLPSLYARYGGFNFMSVPVQPNWDSPQSVFGFFNSVDNRFNASPLLRLLAQSARKRDEGDGLQDQMTLILLDEMNLAHVELYFSDMLSKLEERRGDRKLPSLEVDIGADTDRLRIDLDRNVLWCGTMNEDETTKTLSDKVLDRGNMLVFPRPTELRRRVDALLGDPVPPLSRKTWESWSEQRSPFTDGEVASYKQLLEKISGYMESAGRAIGHRVWQSAEYYMANHPLVRRARQRKDENGLKDGMRIAFEDQVVLKVMPKLRGIETRGIARKNCIEPIATIIDENFVDLKEDFRAALENGSDSFMWRSANYLAKYPDSAAGEVDAKGKAE
jgi:hypothetical protein